ncbi:hypothetical protein HMPREF1051_1391 [Neisseria sicca VK64]|uniref:Uncharacterized protein n=1 Tax=Neisseria sicca VK64 TaxID=1095748 RepID=I2NNK3_NEISI|nr:hypothetical protein HMPREF1051_1391 [Neisseria sicca VK64]
MKHGSAPLYVGFILGRLKIKTFFQTMFVHQRWRDYIANSDKTSPHSPFRTDNPD